MVVGETEASSAFDCYRVKRTSFREGLPPTEEHRLVAAHILLIAGGASYQNRKTTPVPS